LVNIIAMAKDLGLNEHLDDHNHGQCGLTPGECVSRTRIWQTIFILEAMIGAPQGKSFQRLFKMVSLLLIWLRSFGLSLSP
jgi:hypothetical protein